MKRLLSLTMALVVVLVLGGCSKAESTTEQLKGEKSGGPAYGPATHDDHKGHQQGPRR
jgi:hypothetical protein